MSMNVCPDIFWTAKHFVTKPGIAMPQYELECHAGKKIVCCLQGHSHSDGSYDQNMTAISSEQLIPWQLSLV